jgi:hypothetical protein
MKNHIVPLVVEKTKVRLVTDCISDMKFVVSECDHVFQIDECGDEVFCLNDSCNARFPVKLDGLAH